MTFNHRSALFVVLAACHGSQHPPMISIEPDAAVEVDAVPPGPNVVTVQDYGENPIFIVYRDGNGPWLPAEQTSTGWELHIHDAYELVAVCGDASTGFDTGVEAKTLEESGGRTFVPCMPVFDDSQVTVAAIGTMMQAGTVAIGFDQAQSTSANWPFELSVSPGVHDLIAIGNGRMQIRRDLEILDATTLAPIDVVSGGAVMPAVTLTVNGTQASETVTTRTLLVTGNEFQFGEVALGTVVHVAPASQLVTNDQQYLWIRAENMPSWRSVFTRHTPASATTFTLMPPLAGIQLGTNSATWSSGLPDGEVELYVYSGGTSMHATTTTASLGAKTELVIDTDIPGFKPEWRAQPAEYASFSVSARDGEIELRSGFDTFDLLKRDARNIARKRNDLRATALK